MAPELLPALLEASDRPALAFPERTLTYAQLERVSHGLAFAARRGNRRAAILAEPRIETAVAVVAALRGGVPVIPINPRSGSAELAHVLADAAPDALLAAPDADVPEALAGLDRVDVSADPDRGGITLAARLGSGIAGEDPALIVYTSGTTGPPKGAVLPGRALAATLDALAVAWEWTEADVVAHALPLFHVHGLVLGILGPLRHGGCAMHLGRFDPSAVGDALAGPATALFGVPTMYRRLADEAEAEAGAGGAEGAGADGRGRLAAALAGARLLVSGSAALPAAEHARLRRLTGRDVLERYGMTETLMNTAQRQGSTPGAGGAGSVGPPLPGVDLRLVDDDGAELRVADDETIGEVQVRGPNLFSGYLNRADATAEAMRDGWFHTGDMATRLADGAIRLVGRRATDLIKSGGYKIGAGEIEGALREHPAVLDAAVTGEPDDDLGERVVAWVVLRDGAAAGEAELADHVTGLLAPHKRPRTVRYLAELPRNEMGKVVKARLG